MILIMIMMMIIVIITSVITIVKSCIYIYITKHMYLYVYMLLCVYCLCRHIEICHVYYRQVHDRQVKHMTSLDLTWPILGGLQIAKNSNLAVWYVKNTD